VGAGAKALVCVCARVALYIQHAALPFQGSSFLGVIRWKNLILMFVIFNLLRGKKIVSEGGGV
jgi:hypothetical protein